MAAKISTTMTNESKHEKFKRLAKQRGDRVLKDLDLLGNLGNRNNYDYSETDVRKLFSTLEEEIRLAKMRFKLNKKREINF
jgi:hypothetical protein